MIFFFSATGNSKHVARRIAEKTGDEIISITDCLKNGKFDFTVEKSENIGFVMPTYTLGLPITVIDFVEKLNIKTNSHYVFTVATFGTFSGGASRMIKEKLRGKGISVDAQYSVRMPDTWTPVFDLSDKDKVRKINENADKKIASIIKKINRQATGNYDSRRLPFSEKFYNDYDKMRKTDRLSVGDECISCGLCARLCPVDAIEIRKSKPVWVKEKCAMCLGCLHHCPEFAIRRSSKTKEHGQYVHK